MAKIHEEHIVIKLSVLMKDSDAATTNIVTPEIKSALEEVASQLLGEMADGQLIIEVVDLEG